ncbi:glycosyltransferase [Glutamicibacter sp. V16R2B1]|uniref:glycosyltransferase n=1 Tax=Glutamicibacter sp. V16R2B1 TaxID=2036207 RepID=UPI0010FEFC82|nr:glycosyltransferase [Glutamicibacter sp. V16R2B1]TLK48797.1 glycosyltransferase [Glutamicibacter sp. V16R2B1]
MPVHPRSTLRNLVNTVGLVYANITDDPSFFALQVVRKFKNPVLRRIFRSVLYIPMSKTRREVLQSMLAEDTSRILLVSERWFADTNRKSSDGLALANVCIAVHQWDQAQRILDQIDADQATARVRARMAWHMGNLREAVEVLSNNGASRQLRHYESELQVLSGWKPVVAPEGNGTSGRDNQVLYFATNSLPYTGSGYAQRTHSTVASLPDAGWRASVATRINYPANIGHLLAPPRETVDAVTYHRVSSFPARTDMKGRLQQQSDELMKLVTESRPSVLHTTTDFSNAVSVRAVADATGLPWVYEVRGQLADTWASMRPDSAHDTERYRLFQAREAEAAQAADHVVTLGEHMKLNLVTAGVAEENITVLPNGIGDKFLEAPVPRLIARAKVSLESDAFYVGTVSSLVPYEGLDTLLKAAALLAPSHPSLRVLIVGDGTEQENLRNLAQELGIKAICRFPGRVPRDDAHLYHASLNAFVVPRQNLAVTRSVTPLKPVEALASGVPVLASDLPALGELIRDGENGHLIKAEDINAWAAAISDLISRPDQAARMGRAGRDFVLRTRTWSSNAHRLSEIYENLISKPS